MNQLKPFSPEFVLLKHKLNEKKRKKQNRDISSFIFFNFTILNHLCKVHN